jgi:hypothetical protein
MSAFQASAFLFDLTQVSVRCAHYNLGYDIAALRALGQFISTGILVPNIFQLKITTLT